MNLFYVNKRGVGMTTRRRDLFKTAHQSAFVGYWEDQVPFSPFFCFFYSHSLSLLSSLSVPLHFYPISLFCSIAIPLPLFFSFQYLLILILSTKYFKKRKRKKANKQKQRENEKKKGLLCLLHTSSLVLCASPPKKKSPPGQ